MGGYGSGRCYGRERREVVENCEFVSVRDLTPLSGGLGEPVLLPLNRHNGDVVGYIRCKTDLLENGLFVMAFHVRDGNQSCLRVLPLGSTPARNDGNRICFLCPMPTGETICGSPVRKLYAPPGVTRLGCRACYQLAYSSSQRRDERLALADDRAKAVEEVADKVITRMDRGEQIELDEAMRLWRHLSYSINDLRESICENLGEY